MAHQFSSGVFNRGLKAWHNLGKVIDDDQITAEQMFSMSDALFPVIKKPLYYSFNKTTQASRRSSLIHGISGVELGVVGSSYEIVPNGRLLEMAQAIEDQLIMDACIVLDEGRKVAFTGLIRDTTADVLPGDAVSRFFVGYLGHDGFTGIGSIYTDVRAVCANTLAMAQTSNNQRSLWHRQGVNKDVSALIKSIDIQRRSFNDEINEFRTMADTQMSLLDYKQMLTTVFAPELKKPIIENGKPVRPRQLEDLRIYNLLMAAPQQGLGHDIKGVANTAWGYYNAVTEVLTSQKGDAKNAIKKFDRAVFGVNRDRLEVARKFCRELAAAA